MEPTIHTRDIKLSDQQHEYIEKKTERLERYMPTLDSVRVDVTAQNARNANERHIAQITLRDKRGTILRAEEHHADVNAAVDRVVDKIYRQIKRYRGKQQKMRRKGVPAADLMMELEPLPLDNEADIDDENPIILRRKKFALQPMSAEEAIDQMELLGHDFFMYYDPDESRVNLVYKRKDGAFGLLQPEVM